MKINETKLVILIKESIKKVLSEWDKDDEIEDMYIGYGNRSQYPTYDRLPGTRYLNPHNSGLAMDALEGGDPYELDEFDPEYTPIRGNDPNWWRSEKPISDKAINEAIKKVLKKKLFESQQSLVDNFNAIANLINLTDPDQFFYIQILKRWKDNKDKGMVRKTDGTYHGGAEYGNFANGTAFKVRSAQELMQLKPKIISLCDAENARAYITSNPRSDSAIQQFLPSFKKRFRDPNDPRVVHAEEILCGQAKDGDIWADERPRFFFDIDTTDKRIWGITKVVLKKLNIPIEDEYVTPSGGLHVIIADRRLKDMKRAIYLLRLFDGPLYKHLIKDFKFNNNGDLSPNDESKLFQIIVNTQANGNSHCFPDRGKVQMVHANFDGKLILYSNVVTAGY